MYVFFTSRRANCSASLRCASSFFATTIRPLVSLSRRWTMPGRISPPTRRQGREMMQERVHQRAAIALVLGGSGARMHHHSGSLVDDGQIVVFVDDVERNLFGHGAQRRTLGRAEHGDALAAPQLQRSLRRCIIHQNFLFGDQLLHPRAAYVEMRRQELIETLAGVVRHNGNMDGEGVRPFAGNNTTRYLTDRPVTRHGGGLAAAFLDSAAAVTFASFRQPRLSLR